MCPEPKFLSIYMDGELPSPWKEKMENHLSECSKCREKFENFKRMQELFKKDTHQVRTIVDREDAPKNVLLEREIMEAAKEKVWQKLAAKRRFISGKVRRGNLWQRRLTIPLPAVAAAAVVLVLLTAFWFRSGSSNNAGYANIPVESAGRASFILTAEEEMPGIIPAADLHSVLQYLGSDRPDIIILQLPENRNFSRYSEPAMIRAADYSRR